MERGFADAHRHVFGVIAAFAVLGAAGAVLYRQAAMLRDHWGASRDYLEIFRTVWGLNRSRQEANRVRIVFADHPSWPPGAATSAEEVAATFALRDAHMLARFRETVGQSSRLARTLIFMGWSHGANRR